MVYIAPNLLISPLLTNVSPVAQVEKPWSIWVSVFESSCLSQGRSNANITSAHCYHDVCLWPTATKAGEGASEAAGAGTASTLWRADAPGGGEEARRARAGTGRWKNYEPTTGPMGTAASGSSGVWDMVSKYGTWYGTVLLWLLLFLKWQFLPIQTVKCTVWQRPCFAPKPRASSGIPRIFEFPSWNQVPILSMKMSHAI